MRNRNEQLKPFDFERHTNLLSEDAFNLHMDLYRNYVKQVNSGINDLELDVYSLNAAKLHEYFFENITTRNELKSKYVEEFFNYEFGGYDVWENNFVDLCLKSKPGSWVAIVYAPYISKFRNLTIGMHNNNIPVGYKIILIIDLWEHSYILDYGTNKQDYISSFLKCINWQIVEQRTFGVKFETY